LLLRGVEGIGELLLGQAQAFAQLGHARTDFREKLLLLARQGSGVPLPVA
jgi:hypothetical protein